MSNYWQQKKVVVTGASGFIGRAVVSHLLTAGARVTAGVSPRFSGSIEGATLVQGDLTNPQDAETVCAGQEVVFHCAALDGGATFKKVHQDEMFSTNTRMGEAMLEAMHKTGVKRMLLVSSIDVYGGIDKPLIEEADAQGQIDLPGYAKSKRMMEIAAKQAVDQWGAEIAIARLGNIYGPGDDITKGRVIPTFIDAVLDGQPVPIADPARELALLFVDDAARSLMDLVEHYAVGDPVNLVGMTYRSLEEIVSYISTLVGKQPIIDKTIPPLAPIRRIMSTKKAQRVIGFHEEISLDEGLKRTISWYRDRRQQAVDTALLHE